MSGRIDTDEAHKFNTGYKVGQDNLKKWGMDMHNPVFFISAILVLVFIIATILYPVGAKKLFDATKGWTIENFDWFFMISGNIFVLYCLALIVLPVGKIRLGGPDAKPDFTRMSWFAMLFAAGMGIGLMFWSIAEPVAYYTDWWGTPLNVVPKTPEAAKAAMGATMFHWGLHPWAIYAVVALALAFFTYNKGLPLTIRSTFFPILGDRAWGIPGHIVDILAVVATIFGLATSLGFGAQQAASGLNFLFGFKNSINLQVIIIICVTAVAVISVVRGLEGGVKVLSNFNMVLALCLLIFVILAGSFTHFFTGLGKTAMAYLEYILPLSNWIDRADEKFYKGWTVFYWAWWISWAPFVGMFIARISKGRTIREFITAVLLVPTLVTIIWMQAFGGNALLQIQNKVGILAEKGLGEVSLAMFQMLENLPLTQLTSFFGIVLVLVFFITSSDSGSLVVDSITAGGKLDAPVPQRIFWATMEGAIAAALLIGGGADALGAIQAIAVTVGLPFTAVMLIMIVSLYLGLKHELKFGYNNTNQVY
ncbi:MAG: BCCT family transporter [Desulfobacula sp.]|uniref:BCCT family transporter n=1 Tax=Desulfobacula sp. TaxID=2593537 RepID=UPI0025C2E5FC|nr:BCCT family transporter [Desulfobacula sp.]MCD4720617.1 BCCT family transporter [Desulfobacula sp.]